MTPSLVLPPSKSALDTRSLMNDSIRLKSPAVADSDTWKATTMSDESLAVNMIIECE